MTYEYQPPQFGSLADKRNRNEHIRLEVEKLELQLKLRELRRRKEKLEAEDERERLAKGGILKGVEDEEEDRDECAQCRNPKQGGETLCPSCLEAWNSGLSHF